MSHIRGLDDSLFYLQPAVILIWGFTRNPFSGAETEQFDPIQAKCDSAGYLSVEKETISDKEYQT